MLAGGKSPLIICDDVADLDEAVDIAHAAIFNNHGQNCCAGSRTFVQAGIYEDFVAKAKAKAQSRTIGDPWTKVDQGPQVLLDAMYLKILLEFREFFFVG